MADTSGSAIYAKNSNIVLDSCFIINNETIFSNLGGLYATGISDSIIIKGCIIDSNSSDGVNIEGSKFIKIDSSEFINNDSTGLYASSDSLIASGIKANNNFSTGIYIECGNFNIDRISSNSNVATNGAGVFINNGAKGTISNSLFVNDTASNTGASIYDAGTLKLINCTIADNHVLSTSTYSDPSDVNVDSTLIAVNTIFSASLFESSENATTKFYYTDVFPSYTPDSSNGLMFDDPKFNDAPNRDYSLASNSPMIDAGTEDSAYIKTDDYEFDLAGAYRIE